MTQVAVLTHSYLEDKGSVGQWMVRPFNFLLSIFMFSFFNFQFLINFFKCFLLFKSCVY